MKWHIVDSHGQAILESANELLQEVWHHVQWSEIKGKINGWIKNEIIEYMVNGSVKRWWMERWVQIYITLEGGQIDSLMI